MWKLANLNCLRNSPIKACEIEDTLYTLRPYLQWIADNTTYSLRLSLFFHLLGNTYPRITRNTSERGLRRSERGEQQFCMPSSSVCSEPTSRWRLLKMCWRWTRVLKILHNEAECCITEEVGLAQTGGQGVFAWGKRHVYVNIRSCFKRQNIYWYS